MAYDSVSFFAGYAVGRLARGYASRPGTAFSARPTGVRTQFYEWAAAYSGAVMYDSPAAYQSYADELPVKQVGANQTFFWSPAIVTVSIGGSIETPYEDAIWGDLSDVERYVETPSPLSRRWEAFFNMRGLNGEIVPAHTRGYFTTGPMVWFKEKDTIPVTGNYRAIAGRKSIIVVLEGKIIKSGERKGQLEQPLFLPVRYFRMYTSEGAGIHYHAGDTFSDTKLFSTPFKNSNDPATGYASFSLQLYRETYLVEPSAWETGGVNDDDYSAAGRAGNIRGSFAVFLNGEMSTSPRNYIISETDKTVYNPVTDQSFDFADWKYDYKTRTYTLTAADNTTDDTDSDDDDTSTSDTIDETDTTDDTADDTADSASVIFGDSSVTITDFSGNSFTVYYSLT